jgi:hypothetical protein
MWEARIQYPFCGNGSDRKTLATLFSSFRFGKSLYSKTVPGFELLLKLDPDLSAACLASRFSDQVRLSLVGHATPSAVSIGHSGMLLQRN